MQAVEQRAFFWTLQGGGERKWVVGTSGGFSCTEQRKCLWWATRKMVVLKLIALSLKSEGCMKVESLLVPTQLPVFDSLSASSLRYFCMYCLSLSLSCCLSLSEQQSKVCRLHCLCILLPTAKCLDKSKPQLTTLMLVKSLVSLIMVIVCVWESSDLFQHFGEPWTVIVQGFG